MSEAPGIGDATDADLDAGAATVPPLLRRSRS
jgi:hypothetical protein